ncbi:MAG: hypothetical protein HKO53_01415 [Gemmatimonadetes bacterium]|nr:hypothetical protein [Gemmatimonadota bacterium]
MRQQFIRFTYANGDVVEYILEEELIVDLFKYLTGETSPPIPTWFHVGVGDVINLQQVRQVEMLDMEAEYGSA